MTSNPQIIADLKVIMEKDQYLELLSTYKGVPFVCKAKVQGIAEDTASLAAQDPSLVCLAHDHLVKVLGSDYFEPAIAEITSIDIAGGHINLTNFASQTPFSAYTPDLFCFGAGRRTQHMIQVASDQIHSCLAEDMEQRQAVRTAGYCNQDWLPAIIPANPA